MFLLCWRYAICATDPWSIPTSVGLLVRRFRVWHCDSKTMRSTDRANPYKHILSGRRPWMGVWPSWLQKYGQRICILRVNCLGGLIETHTYMRNPNLCSLLCCPVPCQVDGNPVLCISVSAASPCVQVWYFFRYVCFLFCDYFCHFCLFISAFPRRSRVSSLPHQLDIEILVWFVELCVAALFFSFLFVSLFPSGLVVPSCCWSIT